MDNYNEVSTRTFVSGLSVETGLDSSENKHDQKNDNNSEIKENLNEKINVGGDLRTRRVTLMGDAAHPMSPFKAQVSDDYDDVYLDNFTRQNLITIPIC
jgi:hypothetical protein